MTYSLETPPPLMTFSVYEAEVAAFSQYLETSDPALIIRSGLIEETCEILDTDPADTDGLHKEIGDGFYYLRAVAGLHGTTLEAVAGVGSFQALQAMVEADSTAELPIYNPDDLTPVRVRPQEELAVRIMRVIDVMNPQTDELWAGYDERPPFAVVLRDALGGLSQFASLHNVQLDEAVHQALDKLHNRPRNPHVIDRAADMTDSGRGRLEQDRLVTDLLRQTVLNNQPNRR